MSNRTLHNRRQLGGALSASGAKSASGAFAPGIEARTPSDQRERPGQKVASHTAHVVPALVARTQFGQILRRVKQNQERFVIDRRGEPQAVILSIEEYLQRFAARPSTTLAAIRRESSRRGLDKLSLRQINQVIGSVRRQRRRATPSGSRRAGR